MHLMKFDTSLRRYVYKNKPWTDGEKDALKDLWSARENKAVDICCKLNRSRAAVIKKASQLNIQRCL